ncbi:uncharacterized protein LOC134213615 [Armigeres subalbatus]|uniref:uncharacterized protein LOC134213615 n=1 Tax=Armigeres subalbatus TaxID=124917 RepID=UPI002ED64AA0
MASMENNCRICCRTESFDPVWLNSWSESFKETIMDMFTYCTQLEVSSGDKLPQKICNACLKNLSSAFQFRKQCRQSNAIFHDLLRRMESSEIPHRVAPGESKPNIGIEQVDVSFMEQLQAINTDRIEQQSDDEKSDQPEKKPLFFMCCFKRCNERTKEYDKLKEHATKCHKARRHGNAMRRQKDHRLICNICLGGFSNRSLWKIHQRRIKIRHELHDCIRCGETFDSEEKLALHDGPSGCRPDTGEEFNETNKESALENELIRRIVEAKGTDDLLRISQEEYKIVKNRTFVDRLHQKELKYSKKQIKLYYACKSCIFQAASVGEMEYHFKSGTCSQGYSFAIGFCPLVIRQMKSLKCEACNYQCYRNRNMREHQSNQNHQGVRRSIITRLVAVRNFPCEFCGRILSTTANRKRHRSKCTLASLMRTRKRIESDNTEPNRMDTDEQLLSKEHDELESLATEIKIEEYDPLDMICKASNDPNQECSETPSSQPIIIPVETINGAKTKKLPLVCRFCGYSTKVRGNLNRHIRTCRKNINREIPPIRKQVERIGSLFSCQDCGYGTNKRGNMNRHLKTCTSIVPRKESTYFGSSDSEGE